MTFLTICVPPYLTNYRSRDGRIVPNDDNDRWLEPAFKQLHRVLHPHRFCVTFYGWPQADTFLQAFRAAGFRIVGHLVFTKRYTSSERFVRYQHEQAYLLAKGEPAKRKEPISDVREWEYTGNKLHPTQKPVNPLISLIKAFSWPGEVVLDPFCGSGSTLVAARILRRPHIGIELDTNYHAAALQRLRRHRLT